MVKKVDGQKPIQPPQVTQRKAPPAKSIVGVINPDTLAGNHYNKSAGRSLTPGSAKYVESAGTPKKIKATTVSSKNEFSQFVDKETLSMRFDECSASVHKLKDRVEIIIDRQEDYESVMMYLIRDKKMFIPGERLQLSTAPSLPVKIIIGS